MSTMRYNLRNIRTLLTEGFTAEELRRLCYDTSDFRPVYDQLNENIGKARVIDLLLEHAERKLLLEHLLILVKEQIPVRYEKHQPYSELIPGIFTSQYRKQSLRDFRLWLLGE